MWLKLQNETFFSTKTTDSLTINFTRDFSIIQVRVWLVVDLRSQTEKEYLLIYKLLSPVHCMSCHFLKKGEMILQHYK